MSRGSDVLRRLSPVRAASWSSLFGSHRLRTVPAAVLEGSELVHLGGGETVPCPGIESVQLAPAARRLGLGTPSLALPAAKVHVLKDVKVCPGTRVVTTMNGRIVAESMTSDMSDRVDVGDDDLRRQPIELAGTVALFRSPYKEQFHTVVDHLPRAALLGQPAMRRVGPITLVHDGPLNDVEELLLPRLIGHQVQLLEVDPGTPIVAERVLLPGYVTRPFAGAIPSWYRRWIDREVAGLRSPGGPRSTARRRYFIDRVATQPRVVNREELDEVLARHHITAIHPSELDVRERIVLFRDAELVVGVIGTGLSNVIFSRSTRVVELLPGQEMLPHFCYMAAAKGLPYEYVAAPADEHHLTAEERLRRDIVVDTVALDAVLSQLS
jgi:hypothetical protein